MKFVIQWQNNDTKEWENLNRVYDTKEEAEAHMNRYWVNGNPWHTYRVVELKDQE